MRRRSRRGFVLLAVLWIVAMLAILAVTLRVAGGDGVRAAQNRTWLEQARWTAEGCVARTRAVLHDALRRDTTGGQDAGRTWASADQLVASAPAMIGSACTITLRASGTWLDINTADADDIAAVLRAAGIAGADSLSASLLDWRDVDDVARTHGAERAWYGIERRYLPRNGSLESVRELYRVKGFERLQGLDSLFSVEPGRIDVNHAPVAVLASLPGFGDEALARMRDHQARGDRVNDLIAFAGELSPPARTAFVASYAELAPLVTTEPDAWIVTARRSVGQPPVTVASEVWLARSPHGIVVTRERGWTE